MKCELCPRKCQADRENGEVGFCGANGNIKIARSALHFWEEPCISGDEGSGTVFFSNCTMKCIFCQNRKISAEGMGYEISVNELADEFLKLMDMGANNINLVTPTHYVTDIIKALEIAKVKGMNLPVVYNTSGYEREETIDMLDGYVDVYLPDMKYYSDKYAARYSGVNRYFEIAKKAIDKMYHQTGTPVFDKKGIMQKGMIVRHLMLPGLLFDTKKIIDYLYETYKDNIYISLMNQYTPTENVKNHKTLKNRLNAKHYEAMINYCIEKGMENVFIQDGETAKESFIPEFYGEK